MAAAALLALVPPTNERWVSTATLAIAVAGALVFLNLLVVVLVHGRRVRHRLRSGRERTFRAHVAVLLEQLENGEPRSPDWLGAEIARFDELERPAAAAMLIERLRPASPEERERSRETLRAAGALDLIVRSTTRRMPWRRALALTTLGWIGAEETLPIVLGRLSDRDRSVREAAVRALGRMGDERALPALRDLYDPPGRVGGGVVYDALVEFGAPAEPVFAEGLRSLSPTVRVASCYGVATLAAPAEGRTLLEPMLADPAAPVRAAAAENLGIVGGHRLPSGLAGALRDDAAAVRTATAVALGSFDDVDAVELAVSALDDPERDAVVRAAESLVRLSRRPTAAAAAAAVLDARSSAWPVERALVYAELGVL
jgi:HEAT repeat protein